ncbi:uncharacterized protein SPPG_02358 [Spizellomyces punctatus DAOM BR117]|uniref:General vesicular transport factor p115 n=1 Tax=Spizellomyces punctatus (strain DAOM BR117) TaxID=645134 RepID=A0A0L0HPI2_SPIPD|nr:uncharacterized protein SPPG_02358 [Spizellomyces punctatus DAOM BR117]KND03311.1 hypothetical protein SPPG_02358 [Spizellomyces punctatus DAOM BR117]|eukprot:XP_016611350.1 hypothetical protein SPPG_02358 [Spizellomyces punctatus DAOM BR117]
MNVFFQGYSALRGDKGTPQSGAETVHKLCDRVQNSTLLEDRRAAVMGLKGLARDWKLEVGTKGMPVLINVLRNDRMDVDIVKATVETLNVLCTLDTPNKGGADDPNDLGVMFTEIYTKDPANVTLLLDILEEVDFYVRFNTVQLLSTLLQNTGARLQDCILTSPLGISRLIDLLDDRREIIRNEGLLLLIGLTQNNADIQKIIAFENAFERLLGIILEEGATDGGIIVQDCLQLTHNLLKYNVSNQNLFRETSCIQRIPSLLTVRTMLPDRSTPVDIPLSHESIVWADQKIVNAVLVLELVRILAAPKNPSAAVNQNVMNHAKIVPVLIEIGLSARIPVKVKTQALYALGDVVRGHKANQDLTARSTIPATSAERRNAPPVPTVLYLIQLALNGGEFPLRAAAAYVFECYVYNNADAQLAVLSTLTPPPPDNPNAQSTDKPESAGSLLISSILDRDVSRKDPFATWFAATLLSHILHGNSQCQQWALATKLDDDEESISLLHRCMFALFNASSEGSDVRISIGILSLLCIWVHECPEAVKELLTEGSNIQFLVAQINQSSVNPLLQGVAAFLLGLLYEYNDDSEPEFTRANLQSLVTSRIGADVYVSRMERLRESKELNNTSQHILKKETAIGPDGQPEVFFDSMFVDLFKTSHDAIAKAITTVTPRGSPPKKKVAQADESVVQSYKDIIAKQEKELTKLREAVPILEAQVAEQATAYTQQIESLQRTIQNLQNALSEQSSKYAELESEQEDLLVCLADQDTQLQKYRERLKAHGEVIEDEDEEEDEDGDGDGNGEEETEETHREPDVNGVKEQGQPVAERDASSLFAGQNGTYDNFL